MNEVVNALTWLHSNGNLDDNEYVILSNYYRDDKRDIEVIKDELRGFYQSKKFVLDKISQINKESFDDVEIVEIEDDKKSILSSVSDLKVDGKDYIELSYDDGGIRIFLNNLDLPAEILFERLLEKSNNSMENVTSSFSRMLNNSIEIELYDFNDISNKQVYDNLSESFKNDINIVKSTFPDKKVISGPFGNIYIICEEDKKDLFVHVVKSNGIYQVLPINNEFYGNGDYGNAQSDGTDSLSSSKSVDSHQKKIGTLGGIKWGSDDSGFMNVLFFIFLVGLVCGMAFMIFFNVFVV